MNKYTIMSKGGDFVAVELGLFQTPKDIEHYKSLGYYGDEDNQSLLVYANTKEEAIAKFQNGEIEQIIVEPKRSKADREVPATPNYKTGKFAYSMLEIFGWILIVLGILAAVVSLNQLSGYRGYNSGFAMTIALLTPGISMAIGGLFSIAFAQVMKATIATAENSQMVLEEIINSRN